VTDAAGIPTVAPGLGVAVADVNNDGWPDIFICSGTFNALFLNDGKGHFKECLARASFSPTRTRAGKAATTWCSAAARSRPATATPQGSRPTRTSAWARRGRWTWK
jgi:hypothetical protein